MQVDLPIDSVFADSDCTKLLGLMIQTEDLSLVEIDLWTRLVAYHYFLDVAVKAQIELSGMKYVDALGVDWCTYANYREKLCKYGLMRKCSETGYFIVCRPSKILNRMELQAKLEKIAPGAKIKGSAEQMGPKPVAKKAARRQRQETRQLELV